MLFDGEYLPATEAVCFIECGLSRIVDFHYSWNQSGDNGADITFERIHSSATAQEMIKGLFPLSNEIRRHIFLPTKSGYTAYMNNSTGGTDPSAFYYMARELKCRGFRVVSALHTFRKKENTGEFGASILEMHCPDKADNRTIYCVHDGYRWEFNEYGKPFPFEDLSLYKKRMKSDRFNPDILESYMSKLGIFFQDEEFYCSPGCPDPVMIRMRGPRMRNYRDITLEEYQNER